MYLVVSFNVILERMPRWAPGLGSHIVHTRACRAGIKWIQLPDDSHDVVVSEFFLISVDVFVVNDNSDRFGYKKNAAFDQSFYCLWSHASLVPYGVFLNIFVAQAATTCD